jgi:hypothetical protein
VFDATAKVRQLELTFGFLPLARAVALNLALAAVDACEVLDPALFVMEVPCDALLAWLAMAKLALLLLLLLLLRVAVSFR